MEVWDLYDKDRNKLSETMIRGETQREGTYRIVVHICIFNSKGEMLIQQRQPFKKGWPNLWDVSVGGNAISGDSSLQAAARELKEELGLDIDFSMMRPSMTIDFPLGFDDVYIIHKDLDITQLKLQYEEVQRVKWADLKEVLRLLDQGEFIPYHRSFLELIFFMRDHEGAHTSTDQA